MSNIEEDFSEVLDKSVISSLRELQEEGDPDIIAEVGGLFLKHAPQKIEAMRKAAAESNAKALEVAAHSLKSSSSYIGAMKLSAISKELELMGRNGNLQGSIEIAASAEAEFNRVKEALQAEMKQ
jgi:HPt (histidine-containing phosphotransfer) domain-containing protein